MSVFELLKLGTTAITTIQSIREMSVNEPDEFYINTKASSNKFIFEECVFMSNNNLLDYSTCQKFMKKMMEDT